MKVEVDVELLIEALSGLKAFGHDATADTQAKLQRVINESNQKAQIEITYPVNFRGIDLLSDL